MADIRAKILPTYFVPDESGSMSSVVGELNGGLTTLLDAMHGEMLAAAMIRFSIIGFSDDVIEHLLLSDLRQVEAMPILGAYNTTSYSAVFRDLRQRIEADVRLLRNEAFLVHRPVIFFLTDGQPNRDDNWERDLDLLSSHDFKYRPNILAFGIGQAVPEIIRRVASRDEFAYIAASGADTGAALARFFQALTASVVASGQNIARGKGELVLAKPEGFVLAVDVLPD
jgi:uncharacterized protein YegL